MPGTSGSLRADPDDELVVATGGPTSAAARVDVRGGGAGLGQTGPVAGLLVVLFPVLLLGFMLFMQRVEEPLNRTRNVDPGQDLERMLDEGDPGDLDTLAREGTEPAVHRFRLRTRWGRRRTHR